MVFPTADSLAYLDGSLAGDYGFDPLGLFAPGNPGALSQRWLHTAELMHCRWAMLGVTGCLVPEYLAHEKVIPKATGVVWFKTGFLPLAGTDITYSLPPAQLFAIQMALMGVVEVMRYREYCQPGSLAADPSTPAWARGLLAKCAPSPVYPGGLLFNPLVLGERPAGMAELQDAEIKHGRLAMLAMLGLAVQAAVTWQGPFDNYLLHVDDPFEWNVVKVLLADEPIPSGVAKAAHSLHGGHGGHHGGHHE